MTPKEKAEKFRHVAWMAEQVEAITDRNPQNPSRYETGVDRFFTCNHLPDELKGPYTNLLLPESVSKELWILNGECMPVRVLLLCFAAAMAETGDL